ncbi:HNH/ENDO VII family nuclease, partial [Vibrio brasiliensis]
AETVLDANATIADKVVAVGGAFAKRTPLGKGVSKAVTKSAGKKIPNCDLCGPPNKRGNAPIGNDGHPVELHHRNQKPDGPLDEMTRTDHRLGDNFKKNHTNTGQDLSQIDRKAWRKEQKDYWKNEWDSGRFDDM